MEALNGRMSAMALGQGPQSAVKGDVRREEGAKLLTKVSMTFGMLLCSFSLPSSLPTVSRPL